jgi:H+/gluconate symporter-like permease
MPDRSARLVTREVLPFGLALLALAGLALAIDAGLHLADQVWIGRWLGIPGLVLILSSFAYSLRKRKITTRGKPVELLRRHERMAWVGALLVLVHAGVHFNAWLGWLALIAMLVNVASGLTGKYLLGRARTRLEAARTRLAEQGLSPDAIEEKLYRDSLTLGLVRQWRVVHVPITLAFAVLAVAHLVAIGLFWDWQ